MHDQDKAILKSLVAVAWADGRVSGEEGELLEALFDAFGAGPDELVELRAYAKTPRSLADIPLVDLSADDRRMLLQHAVLLSFVDGEQSEREKAVLEQLRVALRIAPDEARRLASAAEERAQRFMGRL